MNVVEFVIEKFRTVYNLGMVSGLPEFIVPYGLQVLTCKCKFIEKPFSAAFRFCNYLVDNLPGCKFLKISYDR